MLAILGTIVSKIVLPLAPTIIKLFVSKAEKEAIAPIIDKVARLDNFNIANKAKQVKLLSFIKGNKKIYKFIEQCNWDDEQLNALLSFCVLIAKKPPMVDGKLNIDNWDDKDKARAWEFAGIIVMKWVNMIGKRK